MRASRGGAWKPDLMGVSPWLTPFFLEMMLILPQPLFTLGFYLAVGSLSDAGLGSPGQQDLSEGRKTMIDAQLGEIIEVFFFPHYFIHFCFHSDPIFRTLFVGAIIRRANVTRAM